MELKCPLIHRSDSRTHDVRREISRPPFTCEVCEEKSNEFLDSYYCYTCKMEIHIGCFRFKPEIENHPYHPLHTLKLKITNSKSWIPNAWPDEEEVISPPYENLGGCKCCRRQLQERYYHCDGCKFNINATCALNPPDDTIVKPKKSHGHIDIVNHEGHDNMANFTLFPRRISLPCDACGVLLDKGNDHVYTCLSTNYIAHRKCIEDLPRLIKITRHKHRIRHTPSLFSSGVETPGFSCGVCHKPVNVNYGQYSCTEAGCNYAVHSKCATRKDVWDGKELEEDDDLEEESEDGAELFKMLDDGTIQHCNDWKHKLKYSGENNNVSDGLSFCQACLLLIVDSDSVYSCTQLECNFVLHKACALLPRKIPHPLHKHPLELLPLPTNLYLIQFKVFVEGMFKCSGCDQSGCGFMYRCTQKGCKFQLDVRCASLEESFFHGSHGTRVFLSLKKGKCMRCDTNQCSPFYLECPECTWFLGLKCATLPSVAHYKFDKHPLALCYGENVGRQYWCEICETTLHSSEWFYTCDDCGVTLHVTCLLGKEAYLKPDHVIKINDEEVKIERNKSSKQRPFCGKCTNRCVDPLVLLREDKRNYPSKIKEDLRKYCCTLPCMQKLLDQRIKK